MKKAVNRRKKGADKTVDRRREYHFDYRNARPIRFARLMQRTTITVTLDPDIATVFRTSKCVI